MKILFLLTTLFIFYTYLGYPILLFFWSKVRYRVIDKKYPRQLPLISFVIAAKNEADTIERRIVNILNLDYPKEKYEIIIVSDGSTDDTNQIVERYSAKFNRTRLLAHFPSKGKPYSLNKGVHQARGEIIIFTDSRQWFDKKAAMELVANFSDPGIGCVSGELVFNSAGASSIQKEMGLYWDYEKIIRKLESKIGSVAGATGA
ncbi:glycosyltransferase, partial [Desulfosarcina sp.]|uniref:glycosyltransferase n=1 Tax=Desulfosarcina sp. TaxID=2027861 RepID=UPI0035617E00